MDIVVLAQAKVKPDGDQQYLVANGSITYDLVNNEIEGIVDARVKLPAARL